MLWVHPPTLFKPLILFDNLQSHHNRERCFRATAKDQVAESRGKEMNDTADRALDDQVAQSTPMTPRK
jgi:hypothetical protein